MVKNLNVLITGGAGYLGSVISERLLAEGCRVTVLDNLMYGTAPLFHLCNNESFSFFRGDARDRGMVEKLMKGADVIIPLAAIVGAPACDRDPSLARTVNYDAVHMINELRSK